MGTGAQRVSGAQRPSLPRPVSTVTPLPRETSVATLVDPAKQRKTGSCEPFQKSPQQSRLRLAPRPRFPFRPLRTHVATIITAARIIIIAIAAARRARRGSSLAESPALLSGAVCSVTGFSGRLAVRWAVRLAAVRSTGRGPRGGAAATIAEALSGHSDARLCTA